MADRFLITAPPPTPNGGLHMGHLSGPYLAADVFKRECQQRGHESYYALSTDDHQSYVDTRAADLGVEPAQLVASSRADIAHSIDAFAIACDRFGKVDADYCNYVRAFFSDAYAAGLIDIVDTQVLYCEPTATYPVEAFVKGYCPHCLAGARGGICESCGRPNDGIDLIASGLAEGMTIRTEPRLSIDLEASRDHLTELFRRCKIASPKLRALLAEQMNGPLGRYPLSYHAARGIPVDIQELEGQKINVWAEMYPGHFYHLRQVCSELSSSDRYVQCFGYDNSYFYAIVHGALGDVARKIGRDWPDPEAFIVNRFYNLGFDKFSTSDGHAVWANHWIEEHDPDLTRFFLALHGPEHDEASFVPSAVHERIVFLGKLINRLATAFDQADRPPDEWLRRPLDARPRSDNDLLPCTMHAIASSAVTRLAFLDNRLAAGDIDLLPQIPIALKTSLASLCPNFADAIVIEPGCRMPRVRLRSERDNQLLARPDEPQLLRRA